MISQRSYFGQDGVAGDHASGQARPGKLASLNKGKFRAQGPGIAGVESMLSESK